MQLVREEKWIMRSGHWAAHARECKPCNRGRLCAEGLKILRTRWTLAPHVETSAIATARVDVRSLLEGRA
jgi:hypothetical protein